MADSREKNSYSPLEQARKKSENSLQSMSTIQSSTLEAESSLDVELFIEALGGSFYYFVTFLIRELSFFSVSFFIKSFP